MVKISLYRRVEYGIRGPALYGLVYHDFYRDQGVFAPIILNVLIRLGLTCYWSLRRGMFRPQWEIELRKARNAGFESGLDACKEAGLVIPGPRSRLK